MDRLFTGQYRLLLLNLTDLMKLYMKLLKVDHQLLAEGTVVLRTLVNHSTLCLKKVFITDNLCLAQKSTNKEHSDSDQVGLSKFTHHCQHEN